MNKHQHQLIIDNPNLSHRELARFLCVSRHAVQYYRKANSITPLWKHSGCGIPFVHDTMNPDGVYKVLKFGSRQLARGKLETVMIELERLIFCLENNNGKLPPTRLDNLHDGLEFVK